MNEAFLEILSSASLLLSKLQEELIHFHVESQVVMKNAKMPPPIGSELIGYYVDNFNERVK